MNSIFISNSITSLVYTNATYFPWTIPEMLMKNAKVFKMWAYKRILRISSTDNTNYKEVLCRIGKETEMGITIKRRKLAYIRHFMRYSKYRLLQFIAQEGLTTGGNLREEDTPDFIIYLHDSNWHLSNRSDLPQTKLEQPY